MNVTMDASRLTLLLNELGLPAIKHLRRQFAERSRKEGWPAARFLRFLDEALAVGSRFPCRRRTKESTSWALEIGRRVILFHFAVAPAYIFPSPRGTTMNRSVRQSVAYKTSRQ